MKAIVLSYDDRAPYVDLVLSSYKNKWRECPLQFVIPYNEHLPYHRNKHSALNCKFVKTPKSVKQTMIKLLEDVDDDEFVYWCLDDIYPCKEFQANEVNSAYRFALANPNVGAIRLFRPPGVGRSRAFQTIGKTQYTRGFSHAGFWFHYFIRKQCLLPVFTHHTVDDDTSINVLGPNRQRIGLKYDILFPVQNLATFGETTRGRKRITKNCHEDMKRYGIKPPEGTEYLKHSIFNNRRCDA